MRYIKCAWAHTNVQKKKKMTPVIFKGPSTNLVFILWNIKFIYTDNSFWDLNPLISFQLFMPINQLMIYKIYNTWDFRILCSWHIIPMPTCKIYWQLLLSWHNGKHLTFLLSKLSEKITNLLMTLMSTFYRWALVPFEI